MYIANRLDRPPAGSRHHYRHIKLLHVSCRCINSSMYHVPPANVTSQVEEEEVRIHSPVSLGDDVSIECVAYNLVGDARDMLRSRKCRVKGLKFLLSQLISLDRNENKPFRFCRSSRRLHASSDWGSECCHHPPLAPIGCLLQVQTGVFSDLNNNRLFLWIHSLACC